MSAGPPRPGIPRIQDRERHVLLLETYDEFRNGGSLKKSPYLEVVPQELH